MGNEARSIEIWRAGVAELGTAFGLVEEYFVRAGVISRETRVEFEAEYFGDARGFWLAGSERQLAGCIGLRILNRANEGKREKESCAEIKRMYVREKFRGQGIAQKLLEAAERFARETGYDWIYLDTTNEMIAAARLYEQSGYQRCERYNHNPQATIFMRKKLRSLVRSATKRARLGQS